MARRAGSQAGTYALGVVGLILLAGIMALAATAHRGLPFASTTEVKAAFNNVASLKSGDQVREFSQRIGKVSAIDYADGKAVVTMELDGHQPVYADASAQIWDFSALSQKFVELNLGNQASGPLGDKVVPADRNTDSTDIGDLLNTFDSPTREATSSFLRNVGGGAAGQGEGFQALVHNSPNLLNDVGKVSTALAAPQADLPEFLTSIDRLSQRFTNRRGDIESIVRDFGTTIDAVAVDNAQPLSDSLQKLPSTLDTAKTALDALDGPLADTSSAFAELQPGFHGLGDATPDTRGFLRESVKPLNKVPDVADKAKPAVSDLADTFHDVRPLAPRVKDTFAYAADPLDVLKPYARDTGWWIVRLHSFVSESVAPGIHYANANANVGLQTLTGSALRDQLTLPRNPYPKPGQATYDRAPALGGK
jgi:phospholipid/cholesterol/gamma-HCH transport system substrate-binding protein